MHDELQRATPLVIWLVVTGVCALSGLPVLLRSKESLAGWAGVRLIVAAVLWHGLLGLCVTLIGWAEYAEHRERLIGLAILSGLGGQIVQTHGAQILKVMRSALVKILMGNGGGRGEN